MTTVNQQEKEREKNVCVIARAVAKPGREQELRSLLSGMLSPTRAEEGCNFYRLFEAHEPGRFYFYELWTSETTLDRHATSSHFKQMEKKMKRVLREPFEISLVGEIGAE
jgi:quinol monooxygenase YgiN